EEVMPTLTNAAYEFSSLRRNKFVGRIGQSRHPLFVQRYFPQHLLAKEILVHREILVVLRLSVFDIQNAIVMVSCGGNIGYPPVKLSKRARHRFPLALSRLVSYPSVRI